MGIDNQLDPDILLQDLEKDNKRHKKSGKLRVFLGMCPGVGKTYSMLRAAKERKKEGFDIVIGLVETHERIETKNEIEGLELIPRKKTLYRNIELYEMDIDAILERRPQIVLVDELAHTNIPGSRHPKRYLDVLEILQAGIDVYTTVNIQHIETRSELVKKITGIEIKETVPDSILSEAFQVELIDLNPEELIKRLNEGKVYLGDKAVDALNNFFKIEHLIALRELALRFTAEIVDNHLISELSSKGINRGWKTSDRILVAISHSPHSIRLLRAARSKAQSLEAPWIALYVENGNSLSEQDKKQLSLNIKLAKELGAEFISVYDDNIPNAIKRICLQRNVSQIVMGRPSANFINKLFGGTLLDQITEKVFDVDLLVLSQDAQSLKRNWKTKISLLFEFHSSFQAYYYSILLILSTSLILNYFRQLLGYRSIGYFYLLVILLVSSMAGKGVIFFTALVSALSWNYFFIPPYGTFHIENRDDIVLFTTFFVVALVTGYLSNQKRKKNEILIEREERTNLLYEATKKLSKSENDLEVTKIGKEFISRIIPSELEVFPLDNNDHQLDKNFIKDSLFKLNESEIAVISWSLKNKQKAGFGTDTLSSSTIQALPVCTQNRNYSVVVLRSYRKEVMTHFNLNMLETICKLMAENMEKMYFQKEAAANTLLRESEKLHQALLNSISHELKTPLTAIIGSSSSLISRSGQKEENILPDLENIKISSERLNRVVNNLLDMSRLSGGINRLKLEYFEFNEFLENIIYTFFKDQKIKFNSLYSGHSDCYVYGDAKLLEHAFINIIQNGLQYSQNAEILITAEMNKENLIVNIIDSGVGILPGEEDKIFERFYRSKNVGPGGTGLGLSIVKEVLQLHNGKVSVKNNPSKGACFTLELPLKEYKGRNNS